MNRKQQRGLGGLLIRSFLLGLNLAVIQTLNDSFVCGAFHPSSNGAYANIRQRNVRSSQTGKRSKLPPHAREKISFGRSSSPFARGDADCDPVRKHGSILHSAIGNINDDNNLTSEEDNNDSQSLPKETDFQSHFSFPLDDWQIRAGDEIANGNNVILCAPTGAGKTAVGEMALRAAYSANKNAIYTTPLKALSNQKFVELRNTFGTSDVGLSTGDMSVNRGARLTVMTTEVYRNMAWRASNEEYYPDSASKTNNMGKVFNDLSSNAVVVLDEFHYMGQPGRGGVWEECVITSPVHTQIVCLSATLPNAARLASWIEGVTGRKTVLVEAGTKRPVPLRFLFANTDGINPLFRDADAGPGSPKGLLGLRGDGVAGYPGDKTKEKKSSKEEAAQTGSSDEKFDPMTMPKGLNLNPVLLKIKKKSLERVDRKLKQRVVRSTEKRRSTLREKDQGDGERRRFGRMSRDDRPMTAKGEQRERERLLKNEMRQSVPSLPLLLKRLEQKNLLPAIFFIFSRVGCDEAAKNLCIFLQSQDTDNGRKGDAVTPVPVKKRKNRRGSRKKYDSDEDYYEANINVLKDKEGRSFRGSTNVLSDDTLASIFETTTTASTDNDNPMPDLIADYDDTDQSFFSKSSLSLLAKQGLLSLNEVTDLASRLKKFNKANEEIQFTDDIATQYMMGIGSHHAGMLAAHKAFVETLFRAQLMKVVFATETLAAGINMPARTTVVSSIAKRTGNGREIALLQTSNMLQMAGRAGRRGMDTEGTCVIVATPFEGPDDAAFILTNEVEPIKSQFAPSYSLAVNLVARGKGKLNVARQLVQKSFAMWEKKMREDNIESVKIKHEEEFNQIMQSVLHQKFIKSLIDSLLAQLDHIRTDPAMTSIALQLENALLVLGHDKTFKRESKTYSSLSKMVQIEQTTLISLETEAQGLKTISQDLDDLLGPLQNEDITWIQNEIEAQILRVKQCHKNVEEHVFTSIAHLANNSLKQSSPDADLLQAALLKARSNEDEETPISGEELTTYAKSVIVMNRKRKKKKPQVNAVEDLEGGEIDEQDDTWNDMVALINTLKSYGCLNDNIDEDNIDSSSAVDQYEVTPAGTDVAMLGYENSLWCLTAMGGAWDVAYESIDIDKFKDSMEHFLLDPDDSNQVEDDTPIPDASSIPKPQEESESLIYNLIRLSPAEIAGYVSCLVADEPRGGSTPVMEAFQVLPMTQKRAIQGAIMAAERLTEVQNKFEIAEGMGKCKLELSACDVVTAWAAGCTWNEALEMSGLAPGDLARILSRALDALRQFANLPFHEIRDLRTSVRKVSPGIHPDIRLLCRDAASAMDRFPVKDPLLFDQEDEGSDEDEEGEDNEELREENENEELTDENENEDTVDR